MRVHELAKELKLTSKELLSKLSLLKIPAKAHMSTLDDAAVAKVRAEAAKSLGSKPSVGKASASKPAAKESAKPSKASAVKEAPAKSHAAKEVVKAAVSSAIPATAAKSITPAPSVLAAPKVAAPVAAKPAMREVAAAQPVAVAVLPAVDAKILELRFPITVNELSVKLEIKASDLIKRLIQQGVFASITQQLDQATATKAVESFGAVVTLAPTLEEQLQKFAAPDPAKLVARAPVVTFMGHVDHGKTSLLDAIRQAKVAEQEAGGITQHIGAYEVLLPKGQVTFLDTPGHEAFSALRARGANITDIVVLVVAADDGVMPQTLEAIDHAKAADVLIVVAINKIDRPDANPQKIKQQLAQHDLLAEDWGGKTIMVSVSAKTREGIDSLLEMLLLEAELLELKADPTAASQGTVIEARQTKNRGPVATVLVQQGTLRVGDTVVVGRLAGRVRAMINDRGQRVKEAGPARPVEILGLPEVPQAGDRFLVVGDERAARELASQRHEQYTKQALNPPKRITLEQLHQRIIEGKLKELRLILKADVQGSLEAIVGSLIKLDTEKEEVSFRILHTGIGDISESDVILAAASDAIIVGFHVGIDLQVQVLAAREGVDVHIYQIIYELVGAIKAAIEGLLEPTLEETFLGRADVRKLFQVSKIGMVAGCMVTKGTIRRDATMRVIRGRDRLIETKIINLKRVKDDAREVQEGVECGISLDGNVDLQVGDLLEAWEIKKVARKLG